MTGTDGPLRIYLAAAEPSGDLLAGELFDALRSLDPSVEIAGSGGAELIARGVTPPYDMSGLSVLGLAEGLKLLRLAHERAGASARDAARFNADAAVMIDSWGFMLRLAWKLKTHCPETLRIKYVAPQVFATRPGRAKVLAEYFDHLLAIHPFDAPYFEPCGTPLTFVGNPALARTGEADATAFRAAHAIKPDEELVLVLFGSRRRELERLFRHFADAAARLRAQRPGLRLVTVLAPAIAEQARALIAAEPAFSAMIEADAKERMNAFAAADAALACSGTATLELAGVGTPAVAAYRLDWPSWALARMFLMKAKYISLVNIAADGMLIPEYVQGRCNGAALSGAVLGLLEDADRRKQLSARLKSVTASMAGEAETPALTAARTVLRLAAEAREKKTRSV